MATISEKDKIFKLSQAENTTLSTTGTLTKDGKTYTYSPSDTIYVTPDNMSKQYATITAMNTALATKVDTNQGSANVGKVMTVGADGSLTPQTAQGGQVDTAMSDSSTNAVQNKVIKSYVDTSIDDNIGSAMWQILGGGSNE